MMSPSADRCRRAGEGQPRSSGLRAENPTCRGSHTVRGPNRRRDSPQHSPRQNPRLENSGRGHQRPASLGRTDWCCFDALNLSNTPQSASGRPLPWPSSPLGSVGDAYDNVLTESIIDLYKAECIDTDIFHAGLYKSVGEVEYATAGWVDWCNDRQLHSSFSSANRVRTSPLCCPQTPGTANMKSGTKAGTLRLPQGEMPKAARLRSSPCGDYGSQRCRRCGSSRRGVRLTAGRYWFEVGSPAGHCLERSGLAGRPAE
jgi:hypothetical protein